jgi:arylsulfatase A-like enzyme
MRNQLKLSRRDFLKLLALTPAVMASQPLISKLGGVHDANMPNVLIFVFDAWTARNVQLFGYPRRTMPNLERLAQRATVYHNHYSAGSFTVPGTASLLTGLYPWTHRAVQLGGAGVTPAHAGHNIFALLGDSRSTTGYAQNQYADVFLQQFKSFLDTHIASGEFNAQSDFVYNLPLFKNDTRLAFNSFEENIIQTGKGTSSSLFISMLLRFKALLGHKSLWDAHKREYPKGLPAVGGFFLLEDVVDGAIESLKKLDAPSLAYFHFFPPHEPYAPTRDFARAFNDDLVVPDKPIHPLSLTRYPSQTLYASRADYDRYLASWDAEVGRLYGFLYSSGMLNNSIVILTSDHGEMFERGEMGHMTSILSAPVAHVPLIVSMPGQTERKDIHAYTSSVDITPTLASLTGGPAPAWAEGRVLPGLGGADDPNRSIFSMDAKLSSSFAAFKQFSIAMIKQKHRLIHYQYPNYSNFELYNLEDDPEEMNNLFPSGTSLGNQMKEELLQKVDEFNHPYEK